MESVRNACKTLSMLLVLILFMEKKNKPVDVVIWFQGLCSNEVSPPQWVKNRRKFDLLTNEIDESMLKERLFLLAEQSVDLHKD